MYADSQFTDEELEILMKDRDLVVELGDDDHLGVLDGDRDDPPYMAEVSGDRAVPPSVDAGASEKSDETQGGGASHTSLSADTDKLSSAEGQANADVDGSRSDLDTSVASNANQGEGAASTNESDRSPASTAPIEVPDLPPVSKLEQVIGRIESLEIVRAMQIRDTRVTAQPIYADRIAYLEEVRELDQKHAR